MRPSPFGTNLEQNGHVAALGHYGPLLTLHSLCWTNVLHIAGNSAKVSLSPLGLEPVPQPEVSAAEPQPNCCDRMGLFFSHTHSDLSMPGQGLIAPPVF